MYSISTHFSQYTNSIGLLSCQFPVATANVIVLSPNNTDGIDADDDDDDPFELSAARESSHGVGGNLSDSGTRFFYLS